MDIREIPKPFSTAYLPTEFIRPVLRDNPYFDPRLPPTKSPNFIPVNRPGETRGKNSSPGYPCSDAPPKITSTILPCIPAARRRPCSQNSANKGNLAQMIAVMGRDGLQIVQNRRFRPCGNVLPKIARFRQLDGAGQSRRESVHGLFPFQLSRRFVRTRPTICSTRRKRRIASFDQFQTIFLPIIHVLYEPENRVRHSFRPFSRQLPRKAQEAPFRADVPPFSFERPDHHRSHEFHRHTLTLLLRLVCPYLFHSRRVNPSLSESKSLRPASRHKERSRGPRMKKTSLRCGGVCMAFPLSPFF
jgi:hypothetical protein